MVWKAAGKPRSGPVFANIQFCRLCCRKKAAKIRWTNYDILRKWLRSKSECNKQCRGLNGGFVVGLCGWVLSSSPQPHFLVSAFSDSRGLINRVSNPPFVHFYPEIQPIAHMNHIFKMYAKSSNKISFNLLYLLIRSIFNTKNSQGSVATRLRCNGILPSFRYRKYMLSPTVKEFWQSVNIWRSYRQE